MSIDKTVCELFAGVGGFRCGLNSIKSKNHSPSKESWKTVWFNQWEPERKNQWAYDCYISHFGTVYDLNGEDTTNIDIAAVDKNAIPNHNLLVGGFPCQDYSVARGLNGEKGIKGKKGVLWWSILDILQIKKTPFMLLENVDRLLISPSKQRGRDFGIILSCLNNEGYIVEWRVINAAEYGTVQRRKRVFIFAYKKTTTFAKKLGLNKNLNSISKVIEKNGFFAQVFPIHKIDLSNFNSSGISNDIVDVSENYKFDFQNSGIMYNGIIYTIKTEPKAKKAKNLFDIIEKNTVDEKYFISKERLYYTNHRETHSDETEGELPLKSRNTWQYLKGSKRKIRTAKNGHKYIFSEGAIPMIDEWEKPARTMLTSESSFNRSTHIIRDFNTRRIRTLTPKEAERIQGFPDDWTNTGMPEKTRYFCMGNALVVPLIKKMSKVIERIFESES